MRSIAKVALLVCAAAGVAGAQVLETKTIELRHLKPAEAMKLLSPYVRSQGGGVFDVSSNLAIVTLRDTPDNIVRMEQVLAKYDHTPATIRFVFQLIEADTGPRVTLTSNEQVPVDLDTTLRSVLKFPSYRLLSRSVATAGEFTPMMQQLATRDLQWAYRLDADVGAIRLPDANAGAPRSGRADQGGTVALTISLARTGLMVRSSDGVSQQVDERVISTGLNVPIGHTVVLGTAATRTSGVALILTVRPELVVVRP